MSQSTIYNLDWDDYDEILIIAILRYSAATNYTNCLCRITKNEWDLISKFTLITDNIAPSIPFIIAGNNAYANIGIYIKSETTFSINGAATTYAPAGVKIYKLIK